MAKKYNPVEKYIKLIVKNDRVFSQRVEDKVYLSDGISACKIPYIWYQESVRPLSGIFIELSDGDKATKEMNSSISIINNSNGMDLFKLFGDTTGAKQAHITPFLLEIPKGKKKELLRIFKCGSTHIAAKNTYVMAALDMVGNFYTEGKSTTPLVSNNDEVGFILCPVRIESSVYETFMSEV